MNCYNHSHIDPAVASPKIDFALLFEDDELFDLMAHETGKSPEHSQQ